MAQTQKAIFYKGGNVDTISYPAGSALSAGDVVPYGALLERLVGVANMAIPASTAGSLAISGQFKFKKKTSSEFAKGDRIGWDTGNGEAVVVADAALDYYIGVCTETAAAADDFVIGLLNAYHGAEAST